LGKQKSSADPEQEPGKIVKKKKMVKNQLDVKKCGG
jgi:hypothetical protein